MSELIRDITEIARCGAQYRTEALAPYGLKGCHASYLTQICEYPGISQDQLAQRICINKSNVARQAAALEEDGFITRKPSAADKRCLELYPTEKTLELLPKIIAINTCWEECLTQNLSAEEQEVAVKILLQMKEKASKWMDEH